MHASCSQGHTSQPLSSGPAQNVFMLELNGLYSALRGGRPPKLPPLEVTYADYSAWHSARLDSGQLAENIEYWKVGLPPRPA